MMKVDSSVLFDQLLQESKESVPEKDGASPIDIPNSRTPECPRVVETPVPDLEAFDCDKSEFKCQASTPSPPSNVSPLKKPCGEAKSPKTPLSLTVKRFPKNEGKVLQMVSSSKSNQGGDASSESPKKSLSIKLKQHTVVNKLTSNVSVMEEHKYSYDTATKKFMDKKSLKEDHIPCVARSVFSNTVSTRTPVDIMLHQDKINILRQMSQVFNNESTPKPIQSESAESDRNTPNSEFSDTSKTAESVNEEPSKCHNNGSQDDSSLDNFLESFSIEGREGSPSVLEKATDTNELTDCESKSSDKNDDHLVHLVTSKSKEVEQKITVESWKGEDGGDYDIIDGFAFVSFSTRKELEEYSKDNQGRPRKKRKKRFKFAKQKKRRLAVLQKPAAKEDNKDVAAAVTPKISPPEVLDHQQPSCSKASIHSTTATTKEEPQIRLTRPKAHFSGTPLPKRVKIAKGIPLEEDDTLVKSCTYKKRHKPSSSKPNDGILKNTSYVTHQGHLISLRGIGKENLYKVYWSVGSQEPSSASKMEMIDINESFADFALSALKCSSEPDLSVAPHTPKKRQWLTPTKSSHCEEVPFEGFTPKRKAEEEKVSGCDAEGKGNKRFKHNVKRFPSLSREMKRLNMNFVKMNEAPVEDVTQPKGECRNVFCRLGCVCESLLCKPKEPIHCGKFDCMLECTCNISNIASVSSSEKVSASKAGSILKLDNEFKGRLASREKEFHSTVVQSESGFHLVESGRRKRDIKIPERFRDSSSFEDDVRKFNEGQEGGRLPFYHKKDMGIPPEDYVKHIKKLTLEVPWFPLQKVVKIWCMDHSCYECECLEEPPEPPKLVINPPERVEHPERLNPPKIEPKITWLIQEPSKVNPEKGSEWLMKYWVHPTEHSARTCGYNIRNLVHKRHSKDTIPSSEGVNMGTTFKQRSSSSDIMRMSKKSSRQTSKIPIIEESIPSSITEDRDEDFLKASPSKEDDFEESVTEEQIVHQLVLQDLIAEEEQRGELELDLSNNVKGTTLVVTETRFRKLISMCIIGVTGLSKQGRCFIRTSNSSSDLMKMQRIHHMIGNDSIDVGPYMKEIFFPSQAECRTRYVIVRCDYAGRWEIIGVIARKQSLDKPVTPPKTKKVKTGIRSPPAPSPTVSPPPVEFSQDKPFYFNETNDPVLPKITNVMSCKISPKTPPKSPVQLQPKIVRFVPRPLNDGAKKILKKNYCIVTNNRVHPVREMVTPKSSVNQLTNMTFSQTLSKILPVCGPKGSLSIPAQPMFVKCVPKTVGCRVTPAILSHNVRVAQPSTQNRENEPKFAIKNKILLHGPNENKTARKAVKPASASADVDFVQLVSKDTSQCSAIDMRLNFKKLRLHWLPVMFSRKLIFSIFKLSYKSQLPYSLKVKHGNSLLKFFGRSAYVSEKPVLFLGQTSKDVSRPLREKKSFESLFKGTIIKYFIPLYTGKCAVYSYNKKCTHLHRQDCFKVSLPCPPLPVDSLCHPNWQDEIKQVLDAKELDAALTEDQTTKMSAESSSDVQVLDQSNDKGTNSLPDEPDKLEEQSEPDKQNEPDVSTCESSVQTSKPTEPPEVFEPVPIFTKDETAQLLMSTVNGSQKSFGIACYTDTKTDAETTPKIISPTPRKGMAAKPAKMQTWSSDDNRKQPEKRKSDSLSETPEPGPKDEVIKKRQKVQTKDDHLRLRTRKHHNDAERLRRKAIGIMYDYLQKSLAGSDTFKSNFVPKKQILLEATGEIQRLKEKSVQLNQVESSLRNSRQILVQRLENLAKNTSKEEDTKLWIQNNVTNPTFKKNAIISWKAKPVDMKDDRISVDANGSLSIDEVVVSKTSNCSSTSETKIVEIGDSSITEETIDLEEIADLFGYNDSDLSLS